MGRPGGLGGLGGLGPVGSLAVLALAACGPPPPSVVLISLDTVRPDHLSLHGYGRATSPFLERLAAGCTVFEEALAHSASTVPSHRALLHSRYASLVSDGPATPAVAEVFAAHGYETAAFTGAGGVSRAFGFSRGFAHWVEANHPHRTLDEIAPRVLAWLRARPARRPLFLFLHTYDAHLPYDPPPPFRGRLGRASGEDPSGNPDPDIDPDIVALRLRQAAGVVPLGPGETKPEFSASERDGIVRLYDEQLAYLDDRLRELLGAPEMAELLGHALLVITSDHGEEFWEHGGVLHSHALHQELLRVPLLVCLPGRAGVGRREAKRVRHLDVAPTLLDWAGLDAAPSFLGRSLLSSITGDRPIEPLPAVAELTDEKAIIDGGWKLISAPGRRAIHLYDLGERPAEVANRAADRPDLTRDLYRRLRRELGPGMTDHVPILEQDRIDDHALREQLRALGYLP